MGQSHLGMGLAGCWGDVICSDLFRVCGSSSCSRLGSGEFFTADNLNSTKHVAVFLIGVQALGCVDPESGRILLRVWIQHRL